MVKITILKYNVNSSGWWWCGRVWVCTSIKHISTELCFERQIWHRLRKYFFTLNESAQRISEWDKIIKKLCVLISMACIFGFMESKWIFFWKWKWSCCCCYRGSFRKIDTEHLWISFYGTFTATSSSTTATIITTTTVDGYDKNGNNFL